jgi:hypothetical protein
MAVVGRAVYRPALWQGDRRAAVTGERSRDGFCNPDAAEKAKELRGQRAAGDGGTEFALGTATTGAVRAGLRGRRASMDLSTVTDLPRRPE